MELTGEAGAARAKVGCWAEAVSAPEEEPVSLLSVDLPQNWPLLGALTGVLVLLFFRVYTTCFCSSTATVGNSVSHMCHSCGPPVMAHLQLHALC